jgi:hypothetical protein
MWARSSVVGWGSSIRKMAGSIFDEDTEFFFFSSPYRYGPGVDWASNRNEYQKIFLGDEMLPVRKADNLITISEPIP